MTTSTPPAWKWLDECYVPADAPLLSIDSRKLPVSDALSERNDSNPDPTGEDVWPLARNCTAQVTDPVINAAPEHRIGTCHMDPDTGEAVMPGDFPGEKEMRWTPKEATVAAPPQCPVCLHEMENDEGIQCDHCADPIGVESFAVVNGPGGVFVYHLPCYDEVYWGGAGYQDTGQKCEDVGETSLQTPAEVEDKVADTCDEVRCPDEWPETGNPLHAHMRATFDACLAISVAKNADYASSSDPLANFRACQRFGVSLTKGLMVRLSDKFARIGNLLDSEAQVKDEAIADSIDDAINYLAILKYALETE